jgi:D-alanine-D-alanine ligase
VETASARYFGTPKPPPVIIKNKDLSSSIFSFLSKQRDHIEKRIEEWVAVPSRTSDPVGNQSAVKKLDKAIQEIKMKPVKELTDARFVWTWETKAGLEGGTLFIGHIDIPLGRDVPTQLFRREPEWLHGEGIGISRAPLVMMEYALRSLRHNRKLQRLPIGILYYMDEGRDCRYSWEKIKEASSKAARVLVLRPGTMDGKAVIQRRGQRKYRLAVSGQTQRLGQKHKIPEVLLWTCDRLSEIAQLSSRKDKLAISTISIQSDAYPMLLPHRINANLMLSYIDTKLANETEGKIREMLRAKGLHVEFEKISERPPMKERRKPHSLAKELSLVAEKWEIPFGKDSSIWPSVGGLVPPKIPVICGIGPAAKELYTPQEAINRTSLIQRTLLIAQFLAGQLGG